MLQHDLAKARLELEDLTRRAKEEQKAWKNAWADREKQVTEAKATLVQKANAKIEEFKTRSLQQQLEKITSEQVDWFVERNPVVQARLAATEEQIKQRIQADFDLKVKEFQKSQANMEQRFVDELMSSIRSQVETQLHKRRIVLLNNSGLTEGETRTLTESAVADMVTGQPCVANSQVAKRSRNADTEIDYEGVHGHGEKESRKRVCAEKPSV